MGDQGSSREPSPTSTDALEGSKVYVVRGTTGEYSDRCEWSVFAFTDQSAAEAYVEFLTTERQKLGAQDGTNWEERDVAEKAMKVHDPRYQEDYTGTSWYLEETTIKSSASQIVGDSSRDESQ